MTNIVATVANSTAHPNAGSVSRKTSLVAGGDINQIVGRLGAIENRQLADLRPSNKGLRNLSLKKIAKLATSMRSFEIIMPLLITPDSEVIAGEARLEAAKQLGLTQVPCLVATHLTAAQVRAYRIADNKLAEGEWDRQALALELKAIVDLGFSIEFTGFESGEADVLFDELDGLPTDGPDPADEIPERQPAISVAGDLWQLGDHRLICGSTRDEAVVTRLMQGNPAAMVMTDPPFNTAVNGHVSGSGRHPEFAEASGEMSRSEFVRFLTSYLAIAAAISKEGAILSVFMDHRHLSELFASAEACGLTTVNLCVWDKGSGGMGSLYRSQHEMVLILKKGTAPHTNNVQLGKYGRYRTNVWSCPGANSFSKSRKQDLADHPTVKPVRLIADAIRDVTHPGELVFDGFMGSGTTICAAERTRRVGYGVEIDGVYVDVAIRRWQTMTGRNAILAATGETFAEVKMRREDEVKAASELQPELEAPLLTPVIRRRSRPTLLPA